MSGCERASLVSPRPESVPARAVQLYSDLFHSLSTSIQVVNLGSNYDQKMEVRLTANIIITVVDTQIVIVSDAIASAVIDLLP